MTTITVDHEHNCETFWDAARDEAKTNPPPCCFGLFESVTTMTLPHDDAVEFLHWCMKIPGWNERPFVISTR